MTAKGHSDPTGSAKRQEVSVQHPHEAGGTSTFVPMASPSPREAADHKLRMKWEERCTAPREEGWVPGLLCAQKRVPRAWGENSSWSLS